MDLTLHDTRSRHSVPYITGTRRRKLQRDKSGKMLKMSVTEHAQMEWAAPIELTPKKDGTLFFCVIYPQLNTVTIRGSYPLRRMDQCTASCGDARAFSAVDANSGYLQIECDEEDRDKTSFNSHHWIFRFSRILHGLKNTSETFQRVMGVVLATLKWQLALFYLEDNIIFSKSLLEHVKHVRHVLYLLSDARVKITLKNARSFPTRSTTEGISSAPVNSRLQCEPPTI